MNAALFIIFSAVAVIISFGSYLLLHESVHTTIFNDHGDDNVSYGVTWNTVYTKGVCIDDPEKCQEMHEMNEVVVYHTYAIIISMWMCIAVLGLWRFM